MKKYRQFKSKNKIIHALLLPLFIHLYSLNPLPAQHTDSLQIQTDSIIPQHSEPLIRMRHKRREVTQENTQANIIENQKPKMLQTLVDTTSTVEEKNTSYDQDKILIKIDKQKRLINSAWKRYYTIHTLLERFVKLEATDRQLNINYYKAQATRINRDQSGVEFLVRTTFPASLNVSKRQKGIIELTRSFSNALDRYNTVNQSDIYKTDASINITLYANNGTFLKNELTKEMEKLNFPFTITTIPANEMALDIFMNSNDFFEANLKSWTEAEQRINKHIRMLEMQLKE